MVVFLLGESTVSYNIPFYYQHYYQHSTNRSKAEALRFSSSHGFVATGKELNMLYSRLSLSRSRRDPLKHFEISVLRHIRCAELRKIPNEQPNFTHEHVI